MDIKTAVIGKQTWMAENLDIGVFQNGEVIPEAASAIAWEQAGKSELPAWCYYKYDPENGTKHGRLYNWWAVKDVRGLAPEGWRIPSDDDWDELATLLGGAEKSAPRLKVIKGWTKLKGNLGGKNTNESGFSGLPSGYCAPWGFSYDQGKIGKFWSDTEAPGGAISISAYHLYYGNDGLNSSLEFKAVGLSVRCIKG